jgi:hypothetical protein
MDDKSVGVRCSVSFCHEGSEGEGATASGDAWPSRRPLWDGTLVCATFPILSCCGGAGAHAAANAQKTRPSSAPRKSRLLRARRYELLCDRFQLAHPQRPQV